MKKIISLLFFLLIVFLYSFAQTSNYSPKSNCSNFNAFIESTSFDSLKYFTDTIYPSGIMIFDITKANEYNNIEDLYSLLGVPESSTFELVSKTVSRFDSNQVIEKYQQFYKGLKIIGAGYTVGYYASGGDHKDPCDGKIAYMLSPFISSDIGFKIEKESMIPFSGIVSSFEDATRIKEELVITQNLLNDCSYRLVYKVDYQKNGNNKRSWVDAKNGDILKTIISDQYKNAPTLYYGTNNLSDETEAAMTILRTSNPTIVTYDFNQANLYTSYIADYQDGLIPTSNLNNDWSTADAPLNVFQAHYVVTGAVAAYHGLGIDFKNLHVGANYSNTLINIATGITFESPNARALGGSTLTEGYIQIGEASGMTLATFDVIGHEMGHVYLNSFLRNNNIGTASLHEGISDMLGVYIEFIDQGVIDWVLGDEASFIVRDLQNPLFNCFDDVENFMEEHDRSTPLGHWFQLITDGDSSTGIEALGIDAAINIVLESLPFIGEEGDYPDMRNAVLGVVDNIYGFCSNQSISIRKAWDQICVGPNYSDINCDFSIQGNKYVCEEDDFLHLYIDGVTTGTTYRWYYPIEWTVQGNTNGGNTYEGTTLIVTDFPDYTWYPRYFQIRVYSLNSNGQQFNNTEYRTVKLIDCDGDDPTCEEYYSSKKGGDNKPLLEISVSEKSDDSISKLVVSDIFGRTIYSGKPSNFNIHTIKNSSVIILIFLNEKHNIVKTEKKVVLD